MKKVLMTLCLVAGIAGFSIAQTTPQQKEKPKQEAKKEAEAKKEVKKEAKHAKHHHAKVSKQK